MRKFTLIIVSLLLTMSAMAQIADVSELSNDKCYQISSIDGARGVFYAAANAEWLSTSGGTYGNYPNRDVAKDPNNPTQQFALIQHNKTYYLYSVSEKKFAVRASNGYIQFSNMPDSYVTIEKLDNYFVIKMNGINKLNLAMPQNAVAGVNANFDETDDGNKLVITVAGEFNPTEALKVFPLKQQQISLITGDLYRDANATNAGTINNTSWCSKWQTKAAKAANTPLITIIAKNNYKNNIQKVSDTDFDFRGGDGSGNTTIYKISISEGYKITGYTFKYTKRQPSLDYSATVSINGTNNTVDTTTKEIAVSDLDTDATEFTITDQNKGVLITEFYVYYKDLKEEARNELQRKIEQIIAWDQTLHIIGPAVGQLSSTNEDFSYDLWDIMLFYSNESENATIEEIEEKITEIEDLTETLEVNMPVSGKAYTFKNVQADANHSTCWFKYDGTNIVLTTVEEEATVFICRELENGNYAFVNNAGKYLRWRGTGNGGVRDNYDTSEDKWSDLIITKMTTGNNYDEGTDMTLTRYMLMQGRRESGSGPNALNYYVIKWNNGNPIFDQANAPFYKQNHNNNGSFSSSIVIEDAEYANTPKLNAVGTSPLLTSDLHNKVMATFSAPFPTVLPDGVTAYYATEDKGDYVSIKPFESRTIPANTGVILVGEEAGNVTMVPAAGETPETISNNLLSHSAGADLEFTTGYILSSKNGQAGFYRAVADANDASKQHLAMNKAYIAIDAIQNSVNLRLFGTTSIENIEEENEDTAIYDLTGRRISEIAKPGIYIINGKKVTVK
ncbi:MAG: hypothetical protein J6V20_07750 [Bacteroidaceae bacterium]|nr:hypothetical protein [Bacteroidaceae bacterium]